MSLLCLWNAIDAARISTFVALVSTVWIIVGWLKSGGRLRTGDARKINHATILAGGVLWFNSGDPLRDRVSCHLAVLSLFALLLVVCRCRTWGLCRYAFLGYSRESDRPHEGFHVWFSWVVSMLGLECVDVAFGSVALTRCAALVLGLADAVGEPIGTRFGKHRYLVRDVLSAARRERSWEGSLAVAVMATLVVFVSISPELWTGSGLPTMVLFSWRIPSAVLAGLIVSLVEAWTPHGLDNLTIPISAAVIVRSVVLLAM